MKNIILIGSTLLFIGTNAFSQSELAAYTTPNYTTEQHFLTDFPNATNVSWNTKGVNEVSFTADGKRMTAFYDYDNSLIGTTSKASYDDMPASARKYIEKHFKDYSPGTVILFDDNEYNDSPMELYETSFDGEDNYFIELVNNNKKIVLQVGMDGIVTFFKDISNEYVK